MSSQYIIDATQENFGEAVLGNSRKGPVLVNYWAENAGPCLRLWPVLEKLVDDYGGRFLLVNVNVGKHKRLASDYGVNSVPTVKLFLDGDVVEQVHGYDSADRYRKILDKYLPRPSDQALAEAVRLYQQGDTAKAFEQLDRLVLLDPENSRIFLSYAKLLIREERYEAAFELLEKTPLRDESEEAVVLMTSAIFLATVQNAAPEETLSVQADRDTADCEVLFQLCSHKMMQSDYPAALALLLRIITQDRNWNRQRPSLCMRGIFVMLGRDDELVKHYRTRLLELKTA